MRTIKQGKDVEWSDRLVQCRGAITSEINPELLCGNGQMGK